MPTFVATTINTTAVTTSTTQAYDGATTIGGNANLSGTTVTFGSTVDDSSIRAQALTVTGSASFGGIVGSTAPSNPSTSPFQPPSTPQPLRPLPLKLTTVRRRSAGTPTSAEMTVTFGSTVNDSAPNTLSLTVTGSASFGGIVGSTALKSIHVTVSTTINTTAITTSTTHAYDGATTIGGNANLSGTTVTFGSTVDDSSIGGTRADRNSVVPVFAGIVGSTALNPLHVTVATTINYHSRYDLYHSSLADGATTIGGNANLSGTTVTFGSTVNDSAPNTHSLTVTGSASFAGIVGSTALKSLHVTVSTTINTTAVTTSTTQAYDGATTIGGNANLSGTTVTFGSTVNDSAPNTHSLTVTGSASFGGIVGSTALKSIHVTVSTTINTTAITTSTTQAYDGATTIGASSTLTASAVTFGSSVDDFVAGSDDLMITSAGTTTFTGAVGFTKALRSFSSGTGTTLINGALFQTTGTQTFNGIATFEGESDGWHIDDQRSIHD